MDQYIKPSELAKELNSSPKTVIRWIKSGKLKAVLIDRHYRISEKAVEEFLKKNKISSERA